MAIAHARYHEDGFLGPLPLLTRRECRALRRHLGRGGNPAPADWFKGHAVTDPLLFRLGSSRRLLELLTPILGEDILLWGCSAVCRGPGENHAWHVDIETAAPDGRFATLWVGLENSSAASSLRLIAGSHRADASVQQIQAEHGLRRGEADGATVLAWARGMVPDARLVEPAAGDGEAILFDGRIWHGSYNKLRRGIRTALIFQYAAADCTVRMPDTEQLSWPFRFLAAPRPPVLVVQGRANGDANRLVPPPALPVWENTSSLSSSIGAVDLPLAEHPSGWRRYHLFGGATPNVDAMESHVSVLSAGHMPHPPHVHGDEELLIVLDGEAELLIEGGEDGEGGVDGGGAGVRIERVERGDFIYYPAFHCHSIRNPGDAPVTYLMFKWKAAPVRQAQDALGVTLVRHRDRAEPATSDGFASSLVFEQATGFLGRLRCHRSRLAPGGGYEPHVDAHDVAIVIQSGRVQTLGQEVGPSGVIHHAAGEQHGMSNIGEEPARYLVFEFHSPGTAFDVRAQRLRAVARRMRSLARRAVRAVVLGTRVRGRDS